jgi:hypothetical protein
MAGNQRFGMADGETFPYFERMNDCKAVKDVDSETGEFVLTAAHFMAMATVHGMHTIPDGQGKVHYMKPGEWVCLDGTYDSWVPLDAEPLSNQICRVSLTQRERDRREAARLRMVEIYKQSPLYRARAEKNPTYWDTFHPGGLL